MKLTVLFRTYLMGLYFEREKSIYVFMPISTRCGIDCTTSNAGETITFCISNTEECFDVLMKCRCLKCQRNLHFPTNSKICLYVNIQGYKRTIIMMSNAYVYCFNTYPIYTGTPASLESF